MKLRSLWRLTRGFLSAVAARRIRGRPAGPTFLIVAVTRRCNCRCVMCDDWKTPAAAGEGELGADDYDRLFGEAQHLGAMVVSITGGEPLLRDDLEAIVGHAGRRGLSVHVCTNGLLVTEERAAALTAAGLTSVSVSLDSHRAAVHDGMRGVEGAFDKAVAAAAAFRRASKKLRIGINCVLTRSNLSDMAQLVTHARAIGAESIRFDLVRSNLQQRSKPASSFDGILLEEEDLPVLEKQIRRAEEALAVSGLHRNSSTFLHSMAPFLRGDVHPTCYAGYLTCWVDADGQVAPCPNFDGVARFPEASLPSIWASPAFEDARAMVKTCPEPCWDTTYAELGVKLSPVTLLRDPTHYWKEICFFLR